MSVQKNLKDGTFNANMSSGQTGANQQQWPCELVDGDFALQQQAVKQMARQQLSVSTDSPFNQQDAGGEQERNQCDQLQKDTDEIRRQLELVREKLNDFYLAKQTTDPSNTEQEIQETQGQICKSSTDEAGQRELDSKIRSSMKSDTRQEAAGDDNKRRACHKPEARLRPLTGQADCPNCACDRRRQSICDSCLNFRQSNSSVAKRREPAVRRPSFIANFGQQTEVKVGSNLASSKKEEPIVARELVPNQLFTIGRSLDDKRGKLAGAIEELQLLMNRVKQRAERLDQERKLARMYRDQWRFGPAIGGGNNKQPASCYQSRLDPQLARDSNSLMGFQHIEPALKLRQSSIKTSSSLVKSARLAVAPQPRPRLSKMKTNERMPSVAHQLAFSNRLAQSKQTTSSLQRHARSQSLDSLNGQVERLVVSTTLPTGDRGPVAKMVKAKSELNLANHEEAREAEERTIEEELEEEGELVQSEPNGKIEIDGTKNGSQTGLREEKSTREIEQLTPRAPKSTWVPVFGETEIKTVDRRRPSRKTLVLTGRASGSILHQSSKAASVTALKQRSPSALTAAPVMHEASKKLQFASDLLERERHDSSMRNQLLVTNRFRPSSRQSAAQPGSASGKIQPHQESNASQSREFISDANREISRLERMIGEQQRVLSQLAASSCCCSGGSGSVNCGRKNNTTRDKPQSTSQVFKQPESRASNQLIGHLRERLNKTKTRLARRLEEERARHNQLERQVDSSLRRQSDLRVENELLRKSLARCIDTCLRDIADTFEGLNETLEESAQVAASADPSEFCNRNGELVNAAQLIENNRHLRQMRQHIEAIENQRRTIFEELSGQKLHNKELELQLIQSKVELDQLVEAKRELERQLAASSTRPTIRGATNEHPNLIPKPLSSSAQETSEHQDLSDKTTSCSDQEQTTTTSNTSDSIDAYQRYIKSMTPDLNCIRQERRMILEEFDSIKKMLANLNDDDDDQGQDHDDRG